MAFKPRPVEPGTRPIDDAADDEILVLRGFTALDAYAWVESIKANTGRPTPGKPHSLVPIILVEGSADVSPQLVQNLGRLGAHVVMDPDAAIRELNLSAQFDIDRHEGSSPLHAPPVKNDADAYWESVPSSNLSRDELRALFESVQQGDTDLTESYAGDDNSRSDQD